MYSEDEMVMISALQHLAFCARQCALIHVEQQWAENRLTILGEQLHERVHSEESESRGDVRIARTLRLVSYKLGIVGQSDVVEFYRVLDGNDGGVSLTGVDGRWRPFPVEYKKGKPKQNHEDEVQLCAQALCLEEQLSVNIPEGALFYGEKRRRQPVVFDAALRERTVSLTKRLHELVDSGRTPPPVFGPKCENCSLIDNCNPKWISSMKRKRYEEMLFQEES
jgi:CRISPR-associated exonuclease Cas4